VKLPLPPHLYFETILVIENTTLLLISMRQSARMSKITNDGLTRSGKGCFTHCSCTYMATVGVKGLKKA